MYIEIWDKIESHKITRTFRCELPSCGDTNNKNDRPKQGRRSPSIFIDRAGG
jgi:hypothetical protein